MRSRIQSIIGRPPTGSSGFGDLVGQRAQPRRVAGGEQQRLHAATTAAASDSAYGRPVDAVLGDDRGDQLRRRDVEGRVPRGEARRDLGRVALLDRDLGAGRGRVVDGRARRDDVERDPVMRGEHREPVGADLVRGVAVRGDPVGAGERPRRPRPAAMQRRRGRVGDHGVRDARRSRAPTPSAARPGAAAASRRPRRGRAGRAPTRRAARRRRSRSRRSRARPRCSASARACPARAAPAACAAIAPAALDLVAVDRPGVLGRRVAAHLVERPARG